MKKLIKSIIFILLATMALFCGCFTGCFDITYSFIEDGDFKYYYIKEEDCYAILELSDQGKTKDTLYIPAYFNGRLVKYTNYTTPAISWEEDHYLNIDAQVLYLPYSYMLYRHGSSLFSGMIDKSYIISNDRFVINKALIMRTVIKKIFISSVAFDYLKFLDYDKKIFGDEYNILINNYLIDYSINNNIYSSIQIANTSFHFNYEGAPNEGYFFVDDYERGGLIENTPYEPIRTGYDFAGWYKEPECLNRWDFEADKLPEAKYDENGYVIDFVETKLYAKWVNI